MVNTNKFARAALTPIPDAKTEMGMDAFSSTRNALVDLYFQTTRDISQTSLESLLNSAWSYDPIGTVRLVFQSRDCRGGKGDRNPFKLAYNWLIQNHKATAIKNLDLIPEYGYWKDVVPFLIHSDREVQQASLNLYLTALRSGDRLAFKYAPRPGKKYDQAAKVLYKALGLNEKGYRQYLKENTQVVEQLMCEHEVTEDREYDTATGTMKPVRKVNLTGFGKIVYSTVPSRAMNIYKNAFPKHDPDRFAEFMGKVKSGEIQMKVDSLYPYNLVTPYYIDPQQNAVLDEQWKALVAKYQALAVALKGALPVVDVSGSMSFEVSRGLRAIDVSRSLGLFLSSISPAPWANYMIPFSSDTKLVEVEGVTLYDRVTNMKRKFEPLEGYGTNFIGVFKMILQVATEYNLKQEDLPSSLFFLSDHQFSGVEDIEDPIRRRSVSQRIKKMYEEKGYKAPLLIYWNLRSTDNYPASSVEDGVAMLSGFSPTALKYLLEKGTFNPAVIVQDIVNDPRYEAVKV